MKLSKQEKVLYCFDKIILKYAGESKTSQLFLMRPMRAHVVSQLFYKPLFVNLVPRVLQIQDGGHTCCFSVRAQ